MKSLLRLVCLLSLASPLHAQDGAPVAHDAQNRQRLESFQELMEAQPKLLRISATVDGSGKIVFSRQGVHYEHKNWGQPTHVLFGGEPWMDLSKTPPVWLEAAEHLDLSKAWIVKRQGRDIIALEHTADGFELYLCDSPNGAADYEVIIAIPRCP